MIFDYFDALNWLAILVASLAWFIFNAIWYSIPPISKAWQAAARLPATAPGATSGAPPVGILVTDFVLYFFTSTVMGLLVAATGAADLMDGVILGATLGVAFGVTSAIVVQMFEQKGGAYSVINGITAVVTGALVGGILAAWDK